MPARNDFSVVETTLPARPRATVDRFVDAAVESRLAACANVTGPIRSVYWWQGALERAHEVLVSLKTTREATDALVAWVRKHHPYDVPFVASIPLTVADPAYARWLGSETCPPPRTVRARPRR